MTCRYPWFDVMMLVWSLSVYTVLQGRASGFTVVCRCFSWSCSLLSC